MDLRQATRHIGNAFLNAVETSQEEAACLVLQMPLTRMSRECVFIPTSPPDERTFVVKDAEDLKNMKADSTDIRKLNIIDHYVKRPKKLEDFCLAEFVSVVKIIWPNDVKRDDPYEDNLDDEQHFDEEAELEAEENEDNGDGKKKKKDEDGKLKLLCQMKNGIQYKQRNNPRVICYVNYNRKKDSENHFRERIMLFHPWRNEQVDLIGQHVSFEDHYQALKVSHPMMRYMRRKYENNNELLEEALDEIANEPREEEVQDDADNDEMDIDQRHVTACGSEFALFDPE